MRSIIANGHRRPVREKSYRVTDADVARLKSAGHSEDEVFEVFEVTAALRSLDAGLRATRGETQDTR